MSTPYDNPRLKLPPGKIVSGTTAWQSPSNIALIKYWGKHGDQLPNNPSISFTLDQANTATRVTYRSREREGADLSLTFTFEGEFNESFKRRIHKYLNKILPLFPFLNQLDLTISSENSFPHSSGIASSASAMSALALCICSIEEELFSGFEDHREFVRKASYVSRLGSGSACRSVSGPVMLWGKTGLVEGSDDTYAIPLHQGIHERFLDMMDCILIVDSAKKAVSSSEGHALMENHPLADFRFEEAIKNLESLLEALKTGDFSTFSQITESEALSLHALMMTSDPPYILIKPNTLEIIDRIKDFRNKTALPLCFTLDAGPNIHILYPKSVQEEVEAFIHSELISLCESRRMILDNMGSGPVSLT